jgi:hypothetical protein
MKEKHTGVCLLYREGPLAEDQAQGAASSPLSAFNPRRVPREPRTARVVLPLPRFVLHPLTAVVVAAVHVYLASGHLSQLFGGDVEWTHLWKGLGALGGAYVFAALASRGLGLEGRDTSLNGARASAAATEPELKMRGVGEGEIGLEEDGS